MPEGKERASELGNVTLVSYEDMLKAMECR